MKMHNKKILVTGGAGFIGSHIVESLVSTGAHVTVLDDFSSGSIDSLKNCRKDISIVRGNILDYQKVLKTMRGMDVVSHQAAHLEITKCVKDPVADLRYNTVGSLNVLQAARENGIKKVLMASSACVYGQAQYTPEHELHPTNPNWEYGVSKLAAEKYCAIFAQRYGIDITSFRYSIVYGPREWYGRVLTLFIKRASEGKPLIIFGSGNQQRDFIFVDDVVRLHNTCLATEVRSGSVYNASTGKGTSILQLANLVKKIVNNNAKIIFENVQEGEKSAYFSRVRLVSELQAMVLDNSKAKKDLRWHPQVGLEEGVTREYEWFQHNKRKWRHMNV